MGERLRRRGAGSWEGRVREGGAWIWRSTGAKDKIAARKTLAEWERRAADPSYAREGEATVAGILEDFVASREARGKASETIAYYVKKSGPLVRLLPERLSLVDHRACEAYLAARTKEGARAVKKELGLLGSALRLAHKNGLLSRDPASILPELEDTYKPRSRALSPWELVALASQLPEDRAAHVVWIVATSARWAESLRARREDVGPLVLLRGTKTELALRSVPALDLTRSLLAWALERAGEARLFRPWANVRRDLAQACARAGIPPATPNDLRRTLPRWLRAAGVEPSLIGVFLGHVDSRMAERVYARLQPGELGAVLEQRLLPAVPPASHTGALGVPPCPTVAHHSPRISVPRDGIEPPTRGFSIHERSMLDAAFLPHFGDDVPPAPHGALVAERTGRGPSGVLEGAFALDRAQEQTLLALLLEDFELGPEPPVNALGGEA